MSDPVTVALIASAVLGTASTVQQFTAAKKSEKAAKRRAAIESARRTARLRRESRVRRAQLINIGAATGLLTSSAIRESVTSIATQTGRELEFSQELDAATREQISADTSRAIAGAIGTLSSAASTAARGLK